MYRGRIKSMDYSKLILVEEHFCSNGHDRNQEENSNIIERSERKINIKQLKTRRKLYKPLEYNKKRIENKNAICIS